jgi:hypothetical protein
MSVGSWMTKPHDSHETTRLVFMLGILLAEEERFELPVPFGTAVFKTAALSRSATPPQNQCSSGPSGFDGAPLLLFSCSLRAMRVARRRGPTRAA